MPRNEKRAFAFFLILVIRENLSGASHVFLIPRPLEPYSKTDLSPSLSSPYLSFLFPPSSVGCALRKGKGGGGGGGRANMGSHKDGGGRSFLPYFPPFSLVASDRGGSIINLGGGVCWTQSHHQFDKNCLK